MVMQSLHTNVQALLQHDQGVGLGLGRAGVAIGGDSPGTVTPTEKLARTQSLFLYLVMTLFDGDVGLRAAGERDLGKLREWLGELCRIRENLGGDEGEGEGEGGEAVEVDVDWEVCYVAQALQEEGDGRRDETKELLTLVQRWIFAESLRRTVVMAYSVMAMYGLLKGCDDPGMDFPPACQFFPRALSHCGWQSLTIYTEDLDPWRFTHRWTLSRWLWEARSASEFRKMWKEKPHFVITNYSFKNFLQRGSGRDLDDFSEMLLSL